MSENFIMPENEKSTSLHTICRILIKEIRLERSIQQAQISQLLGHSSVSSWSKVENGETQLSLDHLFTACTVFQIWPAQLLFTAQQYMDLFKQQGWFVAMYGSPLSLDNDRLNKDANEYYSRQFPEGFKLYQVLQTPWPAPDVIALCNVFKWSLDPLWKASLLQNNETIKTIKPLC